MQTTGDCAEYPAGTAVSGRSTADSSAINGPFTVCDALMRERDALVYHRRMLEWKKAELEQSLQKQRSEKEVCPALFVFPSSDALLRTTCYDCVRRTFSTKGTAHQCVHNSAVLSSWSTPIDRGVGATGMTEYQKSFHAHNLMRTLRLSKEIFLGSGNPDAVMRVLTIFQPTPMIRRLELDVVGLTEGMVQSISQLGTAGQLKHVVIRLHEVVDAIEYMLRQQPFNIDYFDRPSINAEALKYLRGLQGCHNYNELNFSYFRALTDISSISDDQTLEVFKLSGCLQLVGVGALGRLPRLKELALSETTVLDEEIHQLNQCHTLVKIDFHSCKALTNVNPLSSIEKLKVLDMSGCTSLTHVGALGKLPALKEVNLSGTPITDDEDVRLLSECNTLVKIILDYCKSLTNVNALASIETLEEIRLSCCPPLIHVAALGKLPKMKLLLLNLCLRIENAEVDSLFSLRRQLGLPFFEFYNNNDTF